MLTSLGHC